MQMPASCRWDSGPGCLSDLLVKQVGEQSACAGVVQREGIVVCRRFNVAKDVFKPTPTQMLGHSLRRLQSTTSETKDLPVVVLMIRTGCIGR